MELMPPYTQDKKGNSKRKLNKKPEKYKLPSLIDKKGKIKR